MKIKWVPSSKDRSQEILQWIIVNDRVSTLRAWAALRDLCFEKARRSLRNHSLDNERDFEEVMQDASAELFFNVLRGRFRGESALCTYFIGIAKNIWIERSSKKQTILLIAASDNVVDPDVDPSDKRQEWTERFSQAMPEGVCTNLLIDFFFQFDANYQLMANAKKRRYESSSTVYERLKKKVSRCIKTYQESIRKFQLHGQIS